MSHWMKSHLLHYREKSGYVWTEFALIRKLLEKYCNAKFVSEDVVYLAIPKRFYKMEVPNVELAYTVMTNAVREYKWELRLS